MERNILVSIITLSYNASNTILDTILSVNSQTYSNIEHIFIDGGSIDKTISVIQSSTKKRNIIISEKDNGIYEAMNKGLRLASGGIVGFLNADDMLYNNRTIEHIVDEFRSGVDCVYGNLIYFNSQEKIVRKWISRKFKSGLFKYSWTPAHPTFYCKKSLYEDFGYYREDMTIASDVDLMFRFLEIHGVNSVYIDKILIKMRVGGISTSSLKSTLTITSEVFKSFNSYGYRYSRIVYVLGKCYKALRQMNSPRYFRL